MSVWMNLDKPPANAYWTNGPEYYVFRSQSQPMTIINYFRIWVEQRTDPDHSNSPSRSQRTR